MTGTQVESTLSPVACCFLAAEDIKKGMQTQLLLTPTLRAAEERTLSLLISEASGQLGATCSWAATVHTMYTLMRTLRERCDGLASSRSMLPSAIRC